MLTQFHEKTQKVLVIAESIAFDLGHNSVGSEHLLLALLKMKDCAFAQILKKYHVEDKMIYDDIVRLFGEKDIQPFYMEYSDVVKTMLDKAIAMTEDKNEDKVTYNTLCLAMLSQKESVAVELLNKYHVPIEEIKEALSDEKSMIQELNQIHELTNMNELVQKEQRLMIGREKELQQIFMTLCKKEKNNILLIGKAGVGKTALVEKCALNINQQNVPEALKNKVIYELNLSSVVAGTKYRGEFEEKFKRIIDKVMKAKNVILFIDEFHNIIGAGGAEGAIDASNILKPYLARSDLTIIGATTIEEYYRYFEKDQAMNRRFSIIKITENTKDETKDILLGLKPSYEQYHHITIPDNIIDDIIVLCDEYLISKVFPDKALDVLDLACVKTTFYQDTLLQRKYIEAVIEELTGMHLHTLSYIHLEHQLNDKIIGQNQALHILVESLQSLESYPHEFKPKGIYLFIGSPGVGKTQSAKELAELLNRPLIKLDMSEYSDATGVNKIIGSSPGYVGYDEGSSLFHELTLHPHSIILLDEIEKAHIQVLHLFLQVFDEGILQDNHHHKISFKDTIIIMTSNALSQNDEVVGFKKKELSLKALQNMFSKEFLNRIDEIIPYHSLTHDDLIKILKLHAPINLNENMIEDILQDYDETLGARGILTKMKKYLMKQKNTMALP
ncbi:MAG: ATP-dependent Clp protease ATP-binding subunit [Erysipelotrichaceae bacterium]|nr:ATP-dependent Clp protease ATP-binding subunit [Erysipelotrichaceae bacterium]